MAGYNIAALPAYTNQQSKEFIIKSILGAATIALLTSFGSFDPTAKGSEAIQLLDGEIVIQDGANCGRNPLGGATLSQAVLTVKKLKINQNYCVNDLDKTWAVEELKRTMKGLPYTDMLFVEDIGNMNSALTAKELEKMIWQGDTTSLDTSLKQIDGFLKQIAAGTPVDLNPNDRADLTVLQQMRLAVHLMPIEVKQEEDFRILIGQDKEDLMLAEIADKNLFAKVDSKTIFGTNKKYEVIPGLNGTTKIVAARMKRLRAGGEMTAATFKKQYSIETENVYFDSHFSLGVVPVYTTEMGIGTFPDVDPPVEGA